MGIPGENPFLFAFVSLEGFYWLIPIPIHSNRVIQNKMLLVMLEKIAHLCEAGGGGSSGLTFAKRFTVE